MAVFKRNEEFVDARRWTGGMAQAMELSKWMGAGSVYQPPTSADPRESLTVPTPFGPRDIKPGDWVVRSGDGAFLSYKEDILYQSYSPVTDEEHRLIQHARHELGMLPNEDQDFVESIINAVKGFCTFKGHSGASADIAIHMVTALLRGDNLLPLTDDPEEWEFHPKEKYGIERDMWQNKRNSKALSEDGGKTYVMVDEGKNPETDEPILHVSEPKDYTPEVQEEEVEENVDER